MEVWIGLAGEVERDLLVKREQFVRVSQQIAQPILCCPKPKLPHHALLARLGTWGFGTGVNSSDSRCFGRIWLVGSASSSNPNAGQDRRRPLEKALVHRPASPVAYGIKLRL